VDDAAPLSAGEAKKRATYVPTGGAPGWVQLTDRFTPQERQVLVVLGIEWKDAGEPSALADNVTVHIDNVTLRSDYARYDAPAVFDEASSTAYLFGGQDSLALVDTVLAVDLSGRGDEVVSVVPGARFATPRRQMAAAWDAAGRSAYLFGGLEADGTSADDVYRFSIGPNGTATLTQLPFFFQGFGYPLNLSAFGASAFWDPDAGVAYLHGGWVQNAQGTRWTSDVLWRFDPSQDPPTLTPIFDGEDIAYAIGGDRLNGTAEAAAIFNPKNHVGYVLGGTCVAAPTGDQTAALHLSNCYPPAANGGALAQVARFIVPTWKVDPSGTKARWTGHLQAGALPSSVLAEFVLNVTTHPAKRPPSFGGYPNVTLDMGNGVTQTTGHFRWAPGVFYAEHDTWDDRDGRHTIVANASYRGLQGSTKTAYETKTAATAFLLDRGALKAALYNTSFYATPTHVDLSEDAAKRRVEVVFDAQSMVRELLAKYPDQTLLNLSETFTLYGPSNTAIRKQPIVNETVNLSQAPIAALTEVAIATVAGAPAIVAGGADGVVLALSTEPAGGNLAKRWRSDLSGPVADLATVNVGGGAAGDRVLVLQARGPSSLTTDLDNRHPRLYFLKNSDGSEDARGTTGRQKSLPEWQKAAWGAGMAQLDAETPTELAVATDAAGVLDTIYVASNGSVVTIDAGLATGGAGGLASRGRIYAANPDGTLRWAVRLPSGEPAAMAVGAFGPGKRPGIAIAAGSVVRVLDRDTGADLWNPVPLHAVLPVTALAATDIDGDGRTEIAAAAGAEVYVMNGTQGASQATDFRAGLLKEYRDGACITFFHCYVIGSYANVGGTSAGGSFIAGYESGAVGDVRDTTPPQAFVTTPVREYEVAQMTPIPEPPPTPRGVLFDAFRTVKEPILVPGVDYRRVALRPDQTPVFLAHLATASLPLDDAPGSVSIVGYDKVQIGARGALGEVRGFRYLHDVDFLDASLGFLVGTDYSGNGAVAKTTDGGSTWALVTGSPFRSPLDQSVRVPTRIDMVSATTGWAVGDQGHVWKTTDGGVTWPGDVLPAYFGVAGTSIDYSVSGHRPSFREVYFHNATTGWIVGGDAWTAATATASGHSGDLYATYEDCLEGRSAYGPRAKVASDAVVEAGVRTIGGRTLRPDVAELRGAPVHEWTCVRSATSNYASYGAAFRTDDGGATWTLVRPVREVLSVGLDPQGASGWLVGREGFAARISNHTRLHTVPAGGASSDLRFVSIDPLGFAVAGGDGAKLFTEVVPARASRAVSAWNGTVSLGASTTTQVQIRLYPDRFSEPLRNNLRFTIESDNQVATTTLAAANVSSAGAASGDAHGSDYYAGTVTVRWNGTFRWTVQFDQSQSALQNIPYVRNFTLCFAGVGAAFPVGGCAGTRAEVAIPDLRASDLDPATDARIAYGLLVPAVAEQFATFSLDNATGLDPTQVGAVREIRVLRFGTPQGGTVPLLVGAPGRLAVVGVDARGSATFLRVESFEAGNHTEQALVPAYEDPSVAPENAAAAEAPATPTRVSDPATADASLGSGARAAIVFVPERRLTPLASWEAHVNGDATPDWIVATSEAVDAAELGTESLLAIDGNTAAASAYLWGAGSSQAHRSDRGLGGSVASPVRLGDAVVTYPGGAGSRYARPILVDDAGAIQRWDANGTQDYRIRVAQTSGLFRHVYQAPESGFFGTYFACATLRFNNTEVDAGGLILPSTAFAESARACTTFQVTNERGMNLNLQTYDITVVAWLEEWETGNVVRT
ncbi:MAG: WD40/YVTN/BNR-like repeat-containing protein, partial [Methanobacteriota archaeon]